MRPTDEELQWRRERMGHLMALVAKYGNALSDIWGHYDHAEVQHAPEAVGRAWSLGLQGEYLALLAAIMGEERNAPARQEGEQ